MAHNHRPPARQLGAALTAAADETEDMNRDDQITVS
jgi:hypothetical protein